MSELAEATLALEVGTTLYFAYRQMVARRANQEVTVTKVGRVWIELSNGLRISKATWDADGGNYTSPGRAWPSKEAWDAHETLAAMWSDLQRDIQRRNLPSSVTPDTINEARQLLGLPVLPALIARGEYGGRT